MAFAIGSNNVANRNNDEENKSRDLTNSIWAQFQFRIVDIAIHTNQIIYEFMKTYLV